MPRSIVAVSVAAAFYANVAAAQHPAADLPMAPPPLSTEERAAAIAAATADRTAISVFDLEPRRDGRLVVTDVTLADPQEKDSSGRFAVVTLYQYDRGATVRRLVDVRSRAVVRESTTDNDTPPLARVELEYARALGLAEPAIVERLGPWRDQVEVEALVSATSDFKRPTVPASRCDTFV